MIRVILVTTSFYRGKDCIQRFIKCMFEEVKNCQSIIRDNFNKPLKMTNEDEKSFKMATHCHICEKKYRVDDVPSQRSLSCNW